MTETARLRVRPAGPDDVELIYGLWTDPRVMTFVGFPSGAPSSRDEIRSQIERDAQRPTQRLLIAERADDGESIGQCKLGRPNEAGVSEPDIKLLPAFWRKGYGRELWAAMIEVLFRETDCDIVQGTPNVANSASIRMMEACGMTRVGRGIFEPLGHMKDIMTPVPHYVYHISRGTWQQKASSRTRNPGGHFAS